MEQYVLGVDQSTSGTKAILFDSRGAMAGRCDIEHRQIVNDRGWVEHDPEEIFANLLLAVEGVFQKTGVTPSAVIGAGLSNQRETALAWDRRTGKPVYNAIVWQCARGEAICQRLIGQGLGETIRRATGIPASPYYSAAKLAWILENVSEAAKLAEQGTLCCSTIDAWVVFKLCGGEAKTDFSNASRTQLFKVSTLRWDDEVGAFFGLKAAWLPRVVDSNSLFGRSDFGGVFPSPIPLHGVMGDSHGALYGQGCLAPGGVKATYGTGSSVMMNVGDKPVFSDKGIVTSLAWGLGGRVNYVLEGNMNYTGAVIRWLVDDLGILDASRNAGIIARQARDIPGLYLVPAFSGLGAPYWDGLARGIICGLSRGVGKAEIVRAAEECIAYQIADIVNIMHAETGLRIPSLKVDGGATRDDFLMQFQADVIDASVVVPAFEELSGSGPAYAAGMALGLYSEDVFDRKPKAEYVPSMDASERERRTQGWRDAIAMVLTR
ncbi:MAG: glycerol kinase GlpK [Planctomycetota bacterium]|jgi:glycerol kinase|nr:glycerol kinase GlpK [Planctomycetota bacterium]